MGGITPSTKSMAPVEGRWQRNPGLCKATSPVLSSVTLLGMTRVSGSRKRLLSELLVAWLCCLSPVRLSFKPLTPSMLRCLPLSVCLTGSSAGLRRCRGLDIQLINVHMPAAL